MLVYGEKDGENETIESGILSNVGEYPYYIENRNWKNENLCKISLFYHLSIYFHVAIQIILIY